MRISFNERFCGGKWSVRLQLIVFMTQVRGGGIRVIPGVVLFTKVRIAKPQKELPLLNHDGLHITFYSARTGSLITSAFTDARNVSRDDHKPIASMI